MLYAYRSGKNRITNKVWIGLEAAEAAAGIDFTKRVNAPRGALLKGCDAESSGDPNETEKSGPELMELLARIADALEKIADHLQKG